jgi:hypothetical protein
VFEIYIPYAMVFFEHTVWYNEMCVYYLIYVLFSVFVLFCGFHGRWVVTEGAMPVDSVVSLLCCCLV